MSHELIIERSKAILFDWDDTLVSTIEAKWAQHKHIALTQYGKELVDEEIRLHWGKPLSKLVGFLYDTDDIDTGLQHLWDAGANFPKKIFDDTLGVLERNRGAGKTVGVVTAHKLIGFDHDLQSLGIPRACFDYIQTEDDTEHHKPDPRVFDPALTWLGQRSITATETVYVGDGLHDMRAAMGAGINFIGVATGLVSVREFEEAGAIAVPDLSALTY